VINLVPLCRSLNATEFACVRTFGSKSSLAMLLGFYTAGHGQKIRVEKDASSIDYLNRRHRNGNICGLIHQVARQPSGKPFK
jgi:hypothetical protein